jgi:hypothetical protein
MIKNILILILLCVPAMAQTKYLRAGASGTASGNDWANAYTTLAQLETGLTRGSTGYVASGTYTIPTMNTVASGTNRLTIRKATVAEHGTSTGWSDSYASGQAVFSGRLELGGGGYWTIDGATGGGPENYWTNNFGIKIDSTGFWKNSRPVLRFTSNYNLVTHVEIDGNVGASNKQEWNYGIDNDGMNIKNTVDHVWVHNVSNKGFATYGGLYQYSFIDKVYPWDDGTWNGEFYKGMHVNPVRIWPMAGHLTIRYCRFGYYQPTGLYTIGGDVYGEDPWRWEFNAYTYGNIFNVTHEQDANAGGIFRGFEDAYRGYFNKGFFFNNSVYGNRFTAVSPEQPARVVWSEGFKAQDLRWFNNIFTSTANIGRSAFNDAVFSHSTYYEIGGTLGGVHTSQTNAQTMTTPPFVDPVNNDFTPNSGISSGLDLSAFNLSETIADCHLPEGMAHTFTTDMFGNDLTGLRGAIAPTVSGAGNLSVSQPTYTVSESGGTLSVFVSRTGGSSGAVGVSYATANGTATAGSDYTSASSTLSWADGNTDTKMVTLTITPDSSVEGNETFTFTISSATGGATIVNSAATITIQDDDTAGELTLSAEEYAVSENGTTVTITVSRVGGSSGAVGVSYATSNETAITSDDYTAASGTLSWTAGDADDKTFTVTISDDSDFEATEAFTVTLSSATGGASLGDITEAIVIITDNDSGDDGGVPLMGSLSFQAEDGLIQFPYTTQSNMVYQAIQTTDPSVGGLARYRVTIPVNGRYIIKLNLEATTTSRDSLFIDFHDIPSQQPTTIFDVSPLTVSTEERTVTWRGENGTFDDPEFDPKQWTLTAGEHTLYIRGREANCKIDSITIEAVIPRIKASGSGSLRGTLRVQ